MGSEDMKVELRDVSLSYQTRVERIDVLNKFNLHVAAHEFIGIVGPSGSGKSSILNLIAGFLTPDAGNVLVDGKPITHLSEAERCRFRNETIGFVFQSFNLIPSFTVRQNIAVPLLIAGKNKDKVDHQVDLLLERVNLSRRSKHYPYELSGGEQQRAAIARALSNEPSLILADEPTGNLDQRSGQVILDLLQELQQEGKTVIVVTHDPKIESYASRMMNMDDM